MKNLGLDKIYVSEKDIAEAKEILGEVAKDMTHDQLKDQIKAMKYLTESWVDKYERSIFNGKTLNEKLSDI